MDLGMIIKKRILATIGYKIYGMSLSRQHSYKQFLLHFERMPHSEVEHHQAAKLRSILEHCGTNIPYYQKLFKKLNFKPSFINSVNDIKLLPLMTKSEITANIELLKEPGCDALELRATGGTSGQPFRFYTDRRIQDICYANTERFFSYAGFEKGIRHAYFWGNAEDFKRAKRIKGRIKNFVDNKFFFNSYNINNTALSVYFKQISKWRNYVITGFPSSIYFFAKYLVDNNLSVRTPQAILTTGEQLYDYQRTMIEKGLNQIVYSFYGCQEFGVLGCECSAHDGFHLDEADAIFEIEPAKHGHSDHGRLVVTSLISYGMPLIRYVLGDIGQLSLEGCHCGRTSLKLVDLQGRITDFIVDAKGNLINFGLFSDVLEFAEGIAQYRVYQHKKGFIDITIQKNDKFSRTEFDRVSKHLSKLLCDRLEITYTFTDSIPTLSSGKFQPVKSDIAADFL